MLLVSPVGNREVVGSRPGGRRQEFAGRVSNSYRDEAHTAGLPLVAVTAPARQIARTSRDTLRVEAAAATAASDSPTGNGALRVVAPALVGRSAELDVLRSAVAAPPAVVTVEGEAGIGKTRLVAELAAHPDMTDRQFLVGGCRRIREPFPLGPVIEAVRALGDDLAGASLSPVAGALRPLLPELADWLPPQPPPLDDRAGDRHRVFRGLVEILASLGPAVLVLEDLHWADERTGEFLDYLLGDPPPRLTVVLTLRGEEVDPAVRAVTARLPASLRRAEVILRPLDVENTGTLAAAILDTDHISEEFAAHLQQRTAGLPFAIEEVVALLRERRDLVLQEGGWARRALDELHVPTGIRDSVLERISRLSGQARAVVEAAAVLQDLVPTTLLTTVSGDDSDRVVAGVAEAVASGLLVERDNTIRFRHALAAQAAYEATSGTRRAQLHGRAATAMEDLEPVPLGQLAHHLKNAGKVVEWVRVAEAAADAAIALGHEAEAVRLLEGPLRDAPLGGDQRRRLALKLGRAATESGSARPELADLVAGAIDDDVPRAVRGELRFWLSMVMQHAGLDTTRRRELLIEAVEDLDDRPDLSAWAMVTLGVAVQQGVLVSEHRQWLRRALETVPSIADSQREIYMRGLIAMGLAYIGDPLWRSLADDIAATTSGFPRSRREAEAYLRVALAVCHNGDHERAGALLAAVLRQDEACEHPSTGQELACVAALFDFYRGQWDGLAERVGRSLDGLVDVPLLSIDLDVVAGCLALATGDVEAARLRLLQLARTVESLGDRSLDALVTAALAREAVVSGDVEDAVAWADRFIRSLEAKGLWAPLVRSLPAIVQLFTVTGHESRARALIARLDDELSDLDAPLAPAALAHARGFLRGATVEAGRNFLTAADEYDRLACPYEAAQAREQAALCLLQVGDADAEDVLAAAMAAFERLGASWDAARCARAARARGVRVSAPYRGGRRGYGDSLSPREGEVARLAAQGHTNREIAAELFISPNTVDKHLGRAMRKLEVQSRRELGDRLAASA